MCSNFKVEVTGVQMGSIIEVIYPSDVDCDEWPCWIWWKCRALLQVHSCPCKINTHTDQYHKIPVRNLISIQCSKSSISLVLAQTPPHPQKKHTRTQQLTYDAITRVHKMGSDTHNSHTLKHTHMWSGVSQSSLRFCSCVWDSCWGCYWTQSVTQRKKKGVRDGRGGGNEK